MPGPPTASTMPHRPRVVVFRANAIEGDSRAKKVSLTLARLGYDVHVLSAVDTDAALPLRHLTAVGPEGREVRATVHAVPIGTGHRDLHRHKVVHRRRRQFRFVDWTPKDEFDTRVGELRAAALASSPATPRGLAARGRLLARRVRWRAQWAVNVAHRLAWRRWDAVRSRTALLATTRGMLPEVEDYAAALAPVLDDLAADVLHVHHPVVLGTAIRAARRRRAAGRPCRVVYDAREDFAGLPVQERGNRRRHAVLVRQEARFVRDADAVVTVSEPIADTLARRYRLPRRPAVVLNVPVDDAGRRPGGAAVAGTPTVREVAGLPAGVPLLVYGGAVSRARGIDVLVEALARPELDGVHAVVVPVPHPHPLLPELQARAEVLGVADRFHVAPPVDPDVLLHYLSGADVAVMPIRTGSANIEAALPNKLFENLHAGLTMVTCDAALIAAFVREHDLGEVFSFGGDDAAAAADLAGAARRALDHPRDSASAHWQQLRRRYSWQGQESTIRELYAGLVAPPTPEGIDAAAFGSLLVLTDGRSS